MKCQNCGAELAADDRFCAKCGERVEKTANKVCKECGKILAEDALFCSGCGTKVALSEKEVVEPTGEINEERIPDNDSPDSITEKTTDGKTNSLESDKTSTVDNSSRSNTSFSNRYIVPESLYFATYIAISDNRLFDREWYQIEDTMTKFSIILK